MDGVETAGCGHPGMPMGMADVAHVLWSEFLSLDPTDPEWIGRDRFVLSGGHGSMLLYSLLHLSGFDLSLDDIKNFRQLGSKTPGHPENFETVGVETTTGPLGQGIGNAVGMALAEAHLCARFPAAKDVLGHDTYVMAGDGDLQEGLSAEACSLGGHLNLGRLILLYDDNKISIDGATDLSFSEDVCARYTAYGWHTSAIDGHDHAAIRSAIAAAKAQDKPALIACRTIIGKNAPNKANTSGVHGSKLGTEELAATKEAMGWPQDAFLVPDATKARWKARREEWSAARKTWDEAWAKLDGETSKTITSWFSGDAPDLSSVAWPTFEAGSKMATRASSGKVLQAIAAAVPNLVGGSADLTPSNKTFIAEGGGDFSAENYAGRNVRFGIREHAMASLMNGMSLHGGLIPYGGTFLVFTDYCRPSIRLAALMGIRAIYVMTHDSIFLGEDGPTHQAVEHVMSLRAIPKLRVIRPGDATETALAWRMALEYQGPTILSLTRQGVPTIDRSTFSADGALRGGYVAWESGGDPELLLIATGSELQLALDVGQTLAKDDAKSVRVVSLPCWKVFEEQDEAYRDSVLPPKCGARVSMEAGVTLGWDRYTGFMGLKIGVDSFGASAPAAELATKYGLSTEQVLEKVRGYLAASIG